MIPIVKHRQGSSSRLSGEEKMYAETYVDYHSAHYMLALARRANSELEGARASLERALEIHPEYVNARQQLAEVSTEISEARGSR